MKITIKELFNIYYEQHLELNAKTALRRYNDYKRYWDKLIGPLKPDKASVIVVSNWFASLAKLHGKPTANNQLRMLRSMMRWCGSRNLLSASDIYNGISYYKLPSKIHYLLPDEVPRFEKALLVAQPDVRDAIMLMLLTGQRKNNVLGMRWVDVDMFNTVWTIPAKQTKSGREYKVPLTKKAAEILERRWNAQGALDFWVFPGREGSSLKYIDKAWIKIRNRAGLRHIRLHDLRHTAATWLAQSGASASIIQQALQHSSITTSQRYVHLAANDARELMNKSQERICA